ALAAKANCRTFFVAHPEEGAAVKSVARELHIDARVFVLNGPSTNSLEIFNEAGLLPVLNSLDQATLWAQAFPDAAAALHVDVGMNRFGVPTQDVDELLQIPSLAPTLLMAHLSHAGTPEDAINQAQLEKFGLLTQKLPGVPTSLSSTGGTLIGAGFGFDMLRLGVGLFGVSPFETSVPEVLPVATLKAEVLQVQTVPAGSPVGYNGTFCADRPSRIATLAVGYGDGLPRHAPTSSENGPSATVHIGGALCPVVGRVSMDLTTVDITEAPEHVVAGDQAEIFGNNSPIEAFASACGTIGYELLTRLSPRTRRLYVFGSN
ncbi:MAG: alanine racemase, partial [Pseudomonadota bacterium]